MTTEGLGWNPLLGIPPTSTYEALEKRVMAGDYPRLVPALGSKNMRWSFRHWGDKLVHGLLGLHRTQYWQMTLNEFVPVEAITECGVLALLKGDQIPGASARYDSGEILRDAHLTCLRCASGMAFEGQQYRNTQKQAAFGRLYGSESMSALVGTNRPNMQQMPRSIGVTTDRMSSNQPNFTSRPRKR